ncbi:hypothetical protein ACFVTX_02630 [Agromyces sp. NPDC058136]|uniref:hypothetical protein n=1 Tax=Agromyces sp. NPDC058136 TaxID=3346354 RepID=UPI0036DC1BBF
MDPITARAALRLDPAAKLTAAQVDAAHHAAVWAHHPSRYVDRAERAAAVNWVHQLDAARAVLLAESAGATAEAPANEVSATSAGSATTVWTPPSGWATAVAAGTGSPAGSAAPGAPTAGPVAMPQAAPVPNRSHRGAWIAGIAGACVLLIGLVVGIGFGVVALGERLAAEGEEFASEELPDSQTYTAEEMGFNFPAALEVYYDDRYAAECPSEFEYGCWQMALLPEESCTRGWVSLSFMDEDGELVDTEEHEYELTAGERTLLVFGGDDYYEAWIDDVVCLDLRPADSNASTQTGQARSFSGSTSPAV